MKKLLGILVLGFLWFGTANAEKPVYDCSNAPHPLSKYPGTCWGDAVWHCLAPNGQKAYDQIQSLQTAGSPGEQGKPYTDGGKEAYELYLKLCKTSSVEQKQEVENLSEEVEKLRDETEMTLEQDEDIRLFEERTRWLIETSKKYKIIQKEREIRKNEERRLRVEEKETQKRLKKLKKLKEEKEKKLKEEEERLLWYLKAVGNIKKMKQIEQQRLRREEEQQKQNKKQSLINEAEKQRLIEEEQQKQNEKQSFINEQQQQRLIEEEQQRQNEGLLEECNEELRDDCNRVFGTN